MTKQPTLSDTKPPISKLRKKYDELEKERNEQFCIREQLAGKMFLREKNFYAYLSSNGD